MSYDELIQWLLEGDVAIQYQVHRDLLWDSRKDLQAKILKEGWGAQLLMLQHPDGHWGRSFYQPKWTSSHYSLLDLRNLNIVPGNSQIGQSIQMIVRDQKSRDGGINPSGTIHQSDVCINGMFLNYACYFGVEEKGLQSVVDYMLDQRMPDGGFNCRWNTLRALRVLNYFEGNINVDINNL